MTTRQIRAQLNAPKRKYPLPLLIPAYANAPKPYAKNGTPPKPTTNPYPEPPIK